jgi:hypothetical protein
LLQMDHQFAEELLASYKKKMTINSRGCWIPTKKPRPDGYVRFSVTKGNAKTAFGIDEPEKETTYYLHHLSFLVENDWNLPERHVDHVSHLCSDPRCFNPEHLLIESPKQNNSRKNCGQIFKCKCGCKVVACRHEPQCIPQ